MIQLSKLHKLQKAPRVLREAALRKLGVDSFTGTRIENFDGLIEIGSEYGGWVVPQGLFGPDTICYCAGCGEDITFDLGLIEKFGCQVYGIDPTPRAVAHVESAARGNKNYHFEEIGLWSEPDKLQFFVPRNPDHVSHSLLNIQKTDDFITVDVTRLSHLMKQNNHTRIDLLKLDIEGAEYNVIESIIEDNLDIRILCVEYDERANPIDDGYRGRIKSSVDSLLEYGYSLVNVQRNGNYTFARLH